MAASSKSACFGPDSLPVLSLSPTYTFCPMHRAVRIAGNISIRTVVPRSPDVTAHAVKPALSITDVTVVEGNSGTTNAVFTVSLSNPSYQAITVDYATSDGTATTADGDYTGASGTLSFAPGEVSKSLAVVVNRDLGTIFAVRFLADYYDFLAQKEGKK